MSKRMTKKEIERSRRLRDIRRGMKIALYEVKQVLEKQGLTMDLPPWYVEYTVAIAEGGRRDASMEDEIGRQMWQSFEANLKQAAAA